VPRTTGRTVALLLPRSSVNFVNRLRSLSAPGHRGQVITSQWENQAIQNADQRNSGFYSSDIVRKSDDFMKALCKGALLTCVGLTSPYAMAVMTSR